MSRRERELRLGVTGKRKVDVKGGCNAAGPFLSIISCLPRPGTRGDCCRLRTDTFWERDDDESKAASGGRCRNGKDEEGGLVLVCSGVVLRACGRESRSCQCLE